MLDVYVLQHVVKSVVKTVYVHKLFMIVGVTAVMDTSAGMLSENPQEFLSTYTCVCRQKIRKIPNFCLHTRVCRFIFPLFTVKFMSI
jgi:hypothetical protein